MTTTTTTTMKMKERIIYKFFVRKFSSFLSQKATRTTKVTEKRAEEARVHTHTKVHKTFTLLLLLLLLLPRDEKKNVCDGGRDALFKHNNPYAYVYASLFFGAASLKAFSHKSTTSHSEHFGLNGVQYNCPNPTNSGFISTHSSFGNHFSKATRVSSGVLFRGEPAFVTAQDSETHPKRSVILWTCTSTHIPLGFSHPTFMIKCPIFGPTPGSSTNDSKSGGMSPPYFSMHIFAAARKYFALFRWNPTWWMISSKSSSVVFNIPSAVSLFSAINLFIVAWLI